LPRPFPSLLMLSIVTSSTIFLGLSDMGLVWFWRGKYRIARFVFNSYSEIIGI